MREGLVAVGSSSASLLTANNETSAISTYPLARVGAAYMLAACEGLLSRPQVRKSLLGRSWAATAVGGNGVTQKYQKEIEDLLGQINADRPVEQARRSQGRPTPRSSPLRAGRAAFVFRVSAGRVFLAGIALLLTGAVLRAFVPEASGLHSLGGYLPVRSSLHHVLYPTQAHP